MDGAPTEPAAAAIKLLKVCVPVKVFAASVLATSASLTAVFSWAKVKLPSTAALPLLVTWPVRLALVVTLPAVKLAAVPEQFVSVPDDGVPSACPE